MIDKFLLIPIFVLEIISQCLCKKFILLPYNSPLCKNTSTGIHKFYEFTISQQLNFETISDVDSVLANIQSSNNSVSPSYLPWLNVDSDESQYYFCRILVKPMGRSLQDHDDNGEYSFWKNRAKINRFKSSKKCTDYLLLQFRHEHNLITNLESHSAEVVNISCKDSLPIIIPSKLRKLYITYFASEYDSPGYLINLTSFIYFQGQFTVQFQRDLCQRQDGFWCGNDTSICLYRELRCDGSDSCFNGGFDELNCPPPSNKTTINPILKPNSAFIDYLPWLALGILPLILLMALVCICNQHRSEVFFDDEEDNLDIEKSQDDNADHIWSSIDGIDQLENIDEKEDIQDECEDCGNSIPLVRKEPLIGLQTTQCPAMVKADITTSCTGNSLNKEYEDIDKAIGSSKSDNCLTNVADPQQNNEIDGKRILYQSTEFPRTVPGIMTMSQITDDDYDLEDVGSLLRKVDKSKIPEELRMSSTKPSLPDNEIPSNPNQSDTTLDYRSDYILV